MVRMSSPNYISNLLYYSHFSVRVLHRVSPTTHVQTKDYWNLLGEKRDPKSKKCSLYSRLPETPGKDESSRGPNKG